MKFLRFLWICSIHQDNQGGFNGLNYLYSSELVFLNGTTSSGPTPPITKDISIALLNDTTAILIGGTSSYFFHISTKVLHNLDTNSVQMINKIYGQPRPIIHTCNPAPSWREQGSKTCSAGVEHLHPQSLFRGPSGILNLLLASSANASITCFSKRGAPMLRFELGSRV